MNGWLVVDKPSGITSRDVVNAAQKWFPPKTKLGHTGTLDPLATGVLVLAVGSATRLADIVQGMGKTYRSRFRLGASSDTDDADGAVVERNVDTPPSEDRVRSALAAFVGTIEQVPPAYSAIKLGGRRSHDLARRGHAVSHVARGVHIYAVRLLDFVWPFVDVEIECGKGTYVRSIARDLGEKLGGGGLVQTLRRTRVGPFTPEQGIELPVESRAARGSVLPLHKATDHLTRVTLSADETRRFCHGQAVVQALVGRTDDQAAIHEDGGELLGIGTFDSSGRIRATIVLGR